MENNGQTIEMAFKQMGISFHTMLWDKKIALTRNNIGFTERNLTFYFCSSFINIKKDAIIWQELPIYGSHQHLDSIIIDKGNDIIDVYYIEAKRIYNENYVTKEKSDGHGSLFLDYERLTKELKPDKIPSLNLLLNECKIVRKHIVLLASLEYKPKEGNDTYKGRVNAIRNFAEVKGMNLLHYNVREGFNVKENDSKINLLYEDKENLLSFVNLDFYLMTKDL